MLSHVVHIDYKTLCGDVVRVRNRVSISTDYFPSPGWKIMPVMYICPSWMENNIVDILRPRNG